MKRKFLDKLLTWKKSNIKLPLLLIGARQTGKTYILKQFCAEYFPEYIYINFDEKSEYLSFFEDSLNPEEIIRKIEVYLGRKIDIETTILFFDEIQLSEKAVGSLKYFNESDKNYKIVCAGSLLGVAMNRFKSSFPVGKVYFEFLHPMDFEEFLLAIGEELLNREIKNAFHDLKPLNETLHKKALDLYHIYLCVGGMPQAIQEYLNKNKDLVNFDRNIHQNIIFSYLADMAKYTTSTQAIKTHQVYHSIPAQLSKKNKKFFYKLVAEKAKKEGYESSINWLLQADLLTKAVKISLPQPPLSAYQEHGYFKLYLSDVGLLTALSKMQFSEILLNSNMIYRGILTENFVAQSFKSKGYDLFYWESDSQAEVDFLLNINGRVIPVEVKSGDHTASKSLNSYIKKYHPEYAVRISSKNFGFTNGIRSIPLYAVCNL